MYQRDNRQKEVRKREKETTEGERPAGRGGERGRQRERPLGSHRGRPEARDSPVSHIHTNVIS